MKREMEERFIKACQGDTDALFRYCYFKLSDREKAKDLVQETFMRTWNYIAQGREIENLRAFFYRTLTNLVIDEYRKKKTVSLDKLAEGGFDPEAEDFMNAEDRLDGERALKLFEKIGKPYQDVLYLKYVEDLSNGEIAEIIKESENAVAVQIHRGLKKIKKLFE